MTRFNVRMSLFWTAMLVFFASIQYVTCLRCFKCHTSSQTHPEDCGEPFKINYMKGMRKDMWTTCGSGKVCVKSKLTVTGLVLYSRGCVAANTCEGLKEKMEALKNPEEGATEEQPEEEQINILAYDCEECEDLDFCNSTVKTSVTKLLLIFSLYNCIGQFLN